MGLNKFGVMTPNDSMIGYGMKDMEIAC